MRRLTLALAAILVAACGSAAVTPPPDGTSGSFGPNIFGQTFVIPTLAPTTDTSVGPADASTWLELAPVGLHFGVAFPSQPTIKSGSVGSPPAPTTFWTYTDPNGRSFQVARTRLAQALPSSVPSALFGQLQDTLFEELEGGSLVSRTDVTVDGRAAISYTIRSGNLLSQGLLIPDKAILYRVSMTYSADRPDDASLQAFLDSFTLMP